MNTTIPISETAVRPRQCILTERRKQRIMEFLVSHWDFCRDPSVFTEHFVVALWNYMIMDPRDRWIQYPDVLNWWLSQGLDFIQAVNLPMMMEQVLYDGECPTRMPPLNGTSLPEGQGGTQDANLFPTIPYCADVLSTNCCSSSQISVHTTSMQTEEVSDHDHERRGRGQEQDEDEAGIGENEAGSPQSLVSVNSQDGSSERSNPDAIRSGFVNNNEENDSSVSIPPDAILMDLGHKKPKIYIPRGAWNLQVRGDELIISPIQENGNLISNKRDPSPEMTKGQEQGVRGKEENNNYGKATGFVPTVLMKNRLRKSMNSDAGGSTPHQLCPVIPVIELDD